MINTPAIVFVGGLMLSNGFMTFAWYGHRKSLGGTPWFVAAIISWGIAFFEYMSQVPANRAGHTLFNVAQLKIVQKVISLTVFVPFAIFYMRKKPSLNYLYAGFCLLGAVFLIFRAPAQ